MTKKILFLTAMMILVFTMSFYYPINSYAFGINSEDIQAAQKLSNESAEQARKMAEQINSQSDQTNFQIEQAKNLANQAIAQAKQAADEVAKAKNNTPTNTTDIITNCTTISTNIETQITKFNEGKNPRIEKFQAVASNMGGLIKKLKEEKTDTKNLENSLTILNKKLKNYISVQDSYVSSISNTKSTACTKPENEFKSSLQDSQNKLTIVKDTAKDLQDYIQKGVRPEVQKVRDQIKN